MVPEDIEEDAFIEDMFFCELLEAKDIEAPLTSPRELCTCAVKETWVLGLTMDTHGLSLTQSPIGGEVGDCPAVHQASRLPIALCVVELKLDRFPIRTPIISIEWVAWGLRTIVACPEALVLVLTRMIYCAAWRVSEAYQWVGGTLLNGTIGPI